MGAQVLILPLALADLEEAAEFYDEQEPGLGIEVYAFLKQCLLSLRQTAGLHRQKRGIYRYVVLGRFPYYSVYYRLEAGIALIAAVIDNRRDPQFNEDLLKSRF
ncbi:plasmid stabilization system protein ParE [Prosthecobacter fusiformis]|uniref:Plasmid stabilization system protein ParE n=1 Tax=Prosthecobacter fusiformis TaxID=48464 RepID=A0A4R7RPD5_9BACT|nr:type II toxin-antitoxin system RelE/ParE family toxin [Prosthecobacter fusiformis]TDU67292.1 plasmid stabilization system protein ParE [Prosthecobacter fusiformis]